MTQANNVAPINITGPTVVTGLDRSVVSIGPKITPYIQRFYSIFLWDLDQNSVVEDSSLDPAGQRKNAEYFFTTPPKQAEMTEPFTTRVIATQNGGKFIESHGSIFKEIRVSGTTGLRPRKGLPNQIPLLPTSSFENLANTFQAEGLGNEIRSIPDDEITGFDDIHFLRNIFRRYSDSQTRPERIVMVWRNIKDNDYWIVEPRDFRLTADSKSPLTYNYQIQLQGLAPFQGDRPEIPDDPLDTLNDVQRFVSRVSEIKQNLTAAFLVLATQTTRIQGAGFFGINNTLGTLTSVIKGVDSLFVGLDSVDDNLLRAAQQADDEFKSAYEALGATLEEIVNDGVETRDSVVREVLNARRQFARILTEPTIRTKVAQQERRIRARAGAAYNRSGLGAGAPTPPRTGGDPTFVGNSSSPGRVSEGRVHPGDTIRDLAKRYLGDYRRWHELVILNDLRAPYTTDGEATSGVLVPGDSFLYPSNTSSTDPLNINPPTQSPDEQEGDLDNPSGLINQTYGRDLRLKSVQSAGDIDLTDVAVSQRGDLATVVGVPNVMQAVRIKFLTEQGELAPHPRFGSRFPIGNKADRFSFNTFRVNTLATLRSDPRVQEVSDLNFKAIRDTLFVDAKLLLIDSQDYVATDFALRRF